MAFEPKEQGSRKSAEQIKRETEIHLAQLQKEDVLRRVIRKAPGVTWDETHALVPVPGPAKTMVNYKVVLPAGWQSELATLTHQSVIKITKV